MRPALNAWENDDGTLRSTATGSWSLVFYGFSFFFGYVIAGVAGISTQPSYRALGNREALATVALVCALGGFCLRVWASSYLSSAIVWHGDPRSGELRVSGPYRFTRNPLYLGNILQAIAIGLVAPWPVLVLVVIGMIAYSYVLIAIEERFLSTMQGETYERYKRSVARLVPIPGGSPRGDAAGLAGRRPAGRIGDRAAVAGRVCDRLRPGAEGAGTFGLDVVKRLRWNLRPAYAAVLPPWAQVDTRARSADGGCLTDGANRRAMGVCRGMCRGSGARPD